MPSAEFELLDRIRRLASPTERSQLIDELDSIRGPEIALFRLWTRVHETWQFDGWTDDGYYASKVDLARDIQLLSATEYGVSDIENGGLHQFFWNGTGVFAPEMIEWLDRAGMPAGCDTPKGGRTIRPRLPEVAGRSPGVPGRLRREVKSRVGPVL